MCGLIGKAGVILSSWWVGRGRGGGVNNSRLYSPMGRIAVFESAICFAWFGRAVALDAGNDIRFVSPISVRVDKTGQKKQQQQQIRIFQVLLVCWLGAPPAPAAVCDILVYTCNLI